MQKKRKSRKNILTLSNKEKSGENQSEEETIPHNEKNKVEEQDDWQQKYKQEMKKIEKKLKKEGLNLKNIVGDGNCLFRSICDQLNLGQSEHISLRSQTIQYMKNNKAFFEGFYEEEEHNMDFDSYCGLMSKSGR